MFLCRTNSTVLSNVKHSHTDVGDSREVNEQSWPIKVGKDTVWIPLTKLNYQTRLLSDDFKGNIDKYISIELSQV